MTTAKKIRAGDAVLHRPSGERWLVAAVNDQGDLYCAGWPCTRAEVADCDLVEATSEERHLEMVFACARIRDSDPRRSCSLQLCTLMMGRGERVPPDVAGAILTGIESNLKQAMANIEAASRWAFDATSLCSPRILPAWAKPADVQQQLARLGGLSIGIRDASMRLMGCFDRCLSLSTKIERPAPPPAPPAPIPDTVFKA